MPAGTEGVADGKPARSRKYGACDGGGDGAASENAEGNPNWSEKSVAIGRKSLSLGAGALTGGGR
jgi:hypothetical protein